MTTTTIICNTALALGWPSLKLEQKADVYISEYRRFIPSDMLAEANMSRRSRSAAFWQWMSEQLLHLYKYQ